jgi:hypothetical protein
MQSDGIIRMRTEVAGLQVLETDGYVGTHVLESEHHAGQTEKPVVGMDVTRLQVVVAHLVHVEAELQRSSGYRQATG